MSEATVGLVVVSHSPALARAVIGLAEEMLHGRNVRIEEAAGLEDGTFGTDAVRVAEAIGRADGGRGVVVLMDLGSAVLSAELAVDLLDPELRDRVVLCAAPLVEGLSVAAVAAGTGAERDEVVAEALRALAGKQQHLTPAGSQNGEVTITATGTLPGTASGTPLGKATGKATGTVGEGVGRPQVGRFEVTWPHGMHARPAAVLVQAVRDLDADVRLRDVTLDGPEVPAGSLSAVATLGAVRGHVVEVAATGPEARQALERVLTLAATGFGDLTAEPPTSPPIPVSEPDPGRAAAGPLPGAPGVAVAPAWLLPSAPLSTRPVSAGNSDPAGQRSLLRAALDDVEKEIRRTREHTARVVGENEAAVFDAHLLLLEDPEIAGRALTAIGTGTSAASAWANAVADAEAAMSRLPDAYQRARAGDVRAVGEQVAARLSDGGPATPATSADSVPSPGEGPVVLVAPDLTPAQAATLDSRVIVAIVLAGGSPTGHSVILARALGIPTVVAAGAAVLEIAPGTLLAVDGTSGELDIDPPPHVRSAFEERARALTHRRRRAAASGSTPAVTLDGIEVHVGANVSSLEDARAAAAAGADLAGLVRTEFLFLGRSRAPDVEEQAVIYRGIAQALPGRRIVVRTLDVGGDKPLGYLPLAAEANPFLGVRGIRLSLARPGLFAQQLRAIVRVAREHPLDVMFPMVSTLEELVAARRALESAADAEGAGLPEGLRVGAMVEVPATALKAAAFASHVDFLSIGTNDLTQYALAAERGNDAVAAVADPLDPGVLALIAAAGRADTTVAVCGELAADEGATGLLLGLGVRELSVAPPAVASVKQSVREVDVRVAADLAQAALAAPDAAAVRALLGAAGPTDG